MVASARRCAAAAQDRATHMARLAWMARRSMDNSTFCDVQFGYGLRFLMLLRQWRVSGRPGQRWHMVAAASRPFRADQVCALWQDTGLQHDAGDLAALMAQWPTVLPGQHRLVFEDGAITLTLLFGDTAQAVARAGFRADVFLHDDDALSMGERIASPVFERDTLPRREDGARSADTLHSWRAILSRYARHAADGALWLSTVREESYRQALRQCAFELQPSEDAPGRWELWRRRSDLRARTAPGLPRPVLTQRRAVVIGAGLAGANVARALALRGWAVDVLAPDRAAHRGHRAAALTPVVSRDDNARARLTRAGAALAWAAWKDLPGTPVRRVGTVQLDRADAPAQESRDTLEALGFPPEWVRTVSPQEAMMLAGVPVTRAGLYFAHGMLVSPDRLIDALLDHPSITVRAGMAGRLIRENDSTRSWRVLDEHDEELARASEVVVASAFGSAALLAGSDLLAPLPRLQAMHALAGEVTYLRRASLADRLHAIVAGEGYVLPAVGGAVTAGSTYVRGAHEAGVTAAGQAVNLGKLQGLLGHALDCDRVEPGRAGQPDESDKQEENTLEPFKSVGARRMDAVESSLGEPDGWAGWRAVVAGRLPMIGPLEHAPGVWLATAYASRGLTWAALAGEMIAGALDGEPDVIETDLARTIAPR